ncbi:MAG: hypothetical protein R3F34_20405 [Planctomycetota bacterium]
MRRKKTVAAVAVIVLLLVAGLVGTGYGLIESERANQGLVEANARLESTNEELARTIGERDDAIAESERRREVAERELARSNEFKNVVAGLFDGIHPETAQGKDTELLEMVLDKTSRWVSDGNVEDPFVAIDVHTFLSNTYNVISKLELSEEHAAAALALAESTYEDGAPALDEARRVLANVRFARGHVEEAIATMEDVLADLRASGSVEDLLRSDLLLSLAQGYLVVGEYERAEAYLLELFELDEGRGIVDRESWFEAHNKYAMALISSGREREAAESLERILPEMEAEIGALHPVTVEAVGTIAGAYSYLGEHDRADELFRVQMDRAEQIYPRENQIRLGGSARYARALERNGRVDEAIERIAEVVDIGEDVLGDDHRDQLIARSDYGGMLARASR